MLVGSPAPRANDHHLGSLRANIVDNPHVMSNASFLQGTPANFSQRKLSHDVRTRNGNNSMTMGNGLQGAGSFLKDLLDSGSPTRKMNNTVGTSLKRRN